MSWQQRFSLPSHKSFRSQVLYSGLFLRQNEGQWKFLRNNKKVRRKRVGGGKKNGGIFVKLKEESFTTTLIGTSRSSLVNHCAANLIKRRLRVSVEGRHREGEGKRETRKLKILLLWRRGKTAWSRNVFLPEELFPLFFLGGRGGFKLILIA